MTLEQSYLPPEMFFCFGEALPKRLDSGAYYHQTDFEIRYGLPATEISFKQHHVMYFTPEDGEDILRV